MRADWEREALAAVEDATRERVITHEQMVTAVADALEPLIRADERTKGKWVLAYRDALMRGLRAKVDALPTVGGVTMPYVKGAEHRYEMVYRADVLALVDGSSHDD